MKYHYFYKITNTVNNKYYYGVHNTDNIDDGYMGSGKILKKAIIKYGIECFKKEILKYFDTTEEAFLYEKEIVNETLIKDENCYNVQIGGKYFSTNGMVPVIDKNGEKFWVSQEIYLNNKDSFNAIWKNRHHKEESKQKTRKKMLPKNSTNKRIWVNKEGKVKYLLKEKLQEYLNDGWKLGRTGYKPRKNKQGVLIQ